MSLIRREPIIYGDWEISFYAPPIPTRNCDWHFSHKDFDGPGDGRYGSGPSIEDCKAQIDDIEADLAA